jgi:hypothetical protein
MTQVNNFAQESQQCGRMLVLLPLMACSMLYIKFQVLEKTDATRNLKGPSNTSVDQTSQVATAQQMNFLPVEQISNGSSQV